MTGTKRKLPGFVRKARARLERVIDSPRLTEPLADRIARRIRTDHARIDWTFVGRDDLADQIRSGQPVIMALWHGRLQQAGLGWDPAWGEFCVVTSSARPGRMVGRIMQRFGLSTLPMREKRRNTATALQVTRMSRAGCTIGFAIDGPEGPARKAKAVPIDWARMTGLPIWLYTNSFEHYRRLPSWDRMVIPKGHTRGCMLYRRWEAEVPRRLDESAREALRARLESDLNALTAEADRMMGHADLIA